jgi:hypothetical protein
MKLRGHLSTARDWALQQLVPPLGARLIERDIQRRICRFDNGLDTEAESPYAELNETDILNAHALEKQRRESILRKAEGNLTALSICLTVLFGVIGWTSTAGGIIRSDCIPPLLCLIPLAGTLYLIMAFFSAFRVMRVDRWDDLWLQSLVRDPQGNGSNDRKRTLIRIILLNQATNLIAANYASASYVCMRNGFLAIGLFMVILIGGWMVRSG